MAFNNLGDLKVAVADWLNREDLAPVIPDFIRIGVDRINSDNRSQNRYGLTELSSVLDGASQTEVLSVTGIDEVETVIINDEVIEQVSLEEYTRRKSRRKACWTLGAGLDVSNDFTILYSLFDAAGNPGGEDAKLLVRGYSAAEFSNYASDTSTFSKYVENPSLYLYAALTEAAIYLRDMEGLAMYQSRYDELMEKIYREYKRAQVMGGMKVSNIGADYYA